MPSVRRRRLARGIYEDTVAETGPWPLAQGLLRDWIDLMARQDEIGGAAPLVEYHADRFPPARKERLVLARLRFEEGDPKGAWKALDGVEPCLPAAEARCTLQGLVEDLPGASSAEPASG